MLERLKLALVGRYTVEREIGRGGMAVVYLAEDLRHGRPVAIKVLQPELSAMLGADRFLREIETAARLNHPHILPLYDSGEADGIFYYVMPYVEEDSLRDRLDREGQLPIEEAVRLAREVADGLGYAHSEGVIHRDIKPGNVMLSRGHAVIADFGIAKAVDEAGGERLTHTGVATGSPLYMSPEQARGEQLDGRTDIYSLGCVLYEMLAGEPPFTGGTQASLMARKALESAPALRVLRSTVPEAVERTVERALANVPADRFPSADEFASALSERSDAKKSRPRLFRTRFTSRSSADSSRPLRQTGAVVLAIAVIGGLLVSIPGVRQTGRKALLGADLPGVAILPFQYVGPDSADVYLAETMSITLSEVVHRTGVFSPSWTAVKRFRGQLPALAEIGRELNVQYILTGDLIVRGGSLQLSVWLTRVRDNVPVWQRTFEGDLQDIADFEFDIARAVIGSLATYVGIEPATIPVRRYTEDRLADSLYARGLYLVNQFYDEDTTLVAKRLFEQAIERDSAFAPAYVALAGTISGLSRVWWRTPPAEAGPQVLELLLRAQALAPELADVWRSFGWYYYVFGWDWTAADLSFKEAIQRSPKDSQSLRETAFVQIATGQTDSAISLVRSASALEPYNPLTVSTECWILYLAHRYSEGAGRCRFVLENIQLDHDAALAIGQTIAFTERFVASPAPASQRDSAAQALLSVWTSPTSRDHVSGEMSVAMRLAQLGWDEEARRLLAAELRILEIRPLRVANTYAALGDMDLAWEWLEKAFEARDPFLAEIRARPEMGPFRVDPRYPDFLRRLNLD